MTLDDIVPIAQHVLAINPAMKLVMIPWSPPAWLKNNASMNSGGDNSLITPQMMPVLAQFFVKTVQSYKAQGLPVWGVTPQNEPEYGSGGYPCIDLTAEDEATFIGSYLGSAFAVAGLDTRIVGFDHNWCAQDGSCPAPYAQSLSQDANAAPFLNGIA